MADNIAEAQPANAPPPPALAPAKSDSAWKVFLAAFAGAAGTAIAGLIFGPDALNAIKKIFVPLPRGAIILVSGDDCGSDWKPINRGRGDFIVIADQDKYAAGRDDPGGPNKIKLKEYLPTLRAQLDFEQLPPPSGNPAAAGAPLFVTKLKTQANVEPTSDGPELELRPPWIAYTACEQK